MSIRAAHAAAIFLAMITATPAFAKRISIDLPAGTVAQQVLALGRLARISVVVPDPRLWSRPVAALQGDWSPTAALAEIARRAGGRIQEIQPGIYRLVPRPPPAPQARRIVLRPRPDEKIDSRARDQDIVVTASKRDLVRRNFAGQYARVAGKDLEFGGAGGTDRLVARTASLASTYLGAGRNKLFIRGIADSSFTGPTQATVGQYYGDLRLAYNAPDPDLRLSDLAAVEVLEGPQGTLYGAGSLGGLIRLVPNAADLERATGMIEGGIAATMHGAPGADAQAVLNVPLLPERLAVRLVANAASEGGYIDKPLLNRNDVNRTRIAGGRATAHLDLGGVWSLELIGIGQRIRSADSQYADRDGKPLTRSAPVGEGSNAGFAQGQMILAGMFGDMHFRSTSGVTAHDLMERYDATPEDGPARLFAQANRTRMQANETRLWRSDSQGSGWLSGFSYIHNRTALTRLYGPPGAVIPTTGVVNAVSEFTVYAEGSRRLLPGLLMTGGLRITRSVLEGEAADVKVSLLPSISGIVRRRAQAVALPSASAIVDLTSRAQFFVRYQQGFRPGGLAIESDSVRRFRSDHVATIEAGIRAGRPNADAIDLSVTVARTLWRDIQADFIDRSGLPSTANIGDGRLWTVEGVFGAKIVDGLRIEGAVSYNASRIDAPAQDLVFTLAGLSATDPASARADVLARTQIPNIAGITARTGAVFEHRLDDVLNVKIDGWLRYVGSSRLGVGPELGRLQGSYLDTSLSARLGSGRVGATVSVTNLADTRGNRFSLGTPFATGRDQVTPLRPRTVRIGLDRSF